MQRYRIIGFILFISFATILSLWFRARSDPIYRLTSIKAKTYQGLDWTQWRCLEDVNETSLQTIVESLELKEQKVLRENIVEEDLLYSAELPPEIALWIDNKVSCCTTKFSRVDTDLERSWHLWYCKNTNTAILRIGQW